MLDALIGGSADAAQRAPAYVIDAYFTYVILKCFVFTITEYFTNIMIL